MGDLVADKVERVANVVMARIEPKGEPQVQADGETKKLEAPPSLEDRKKQEVQNLKAADVPEQVKRVTQIVAALHARRELRARIVAQIKYLQVVHERAEREGRESLDVKISAVRAESDRQVAELKSRFHLEHDLRLGEESTSQADLDKVDLSLDQLRKQLDAELSKLDPERKAGTAT